MSTILDTGSHSFQFYVKDTANVFKIIFLSFTIVMTKCSSPVISVNWISFVREWLEIKLISNFSLSAFLFVAFSCYSIFITTIAVHKQKIACKFQGNPDKEKSKQLTRQIVLARQHTLSGWDIPVRIDFGERIILLRISRR